MGPVSHEEHRDISWVGWGLNVSQPTRWWAAPTDKLWMLGRDGPTAFPGTLQNRETILSLPAGPLQKSVT